MTPTTTATACTLDRRQNSRRSFLRSAAVTGAALLPASQLMTAGPVARAAAPVTEGDLAILRFLAAAELVEDDLWQQYCELAVSNRFFNFALRRIDPSLVRYVCDDRDDERSHANLINGFLVSTGHDPVNLDPFRTLPSSSAPGAEERGRLTNLTKLTIDTSWFYRYRGQGNPDFGNTFPQLVEIRERPTIPTNRFTSLFEAQVLANTAALHFATIEQGGASLYNALLTKVSNVDVVAILASIGPTEVYHFAAFHKSLEGLPALLFDGDLDFLDLRRQPELAQAIFPEPCTFLSRDLPLCSVIRPHSTEQAGAIATATALVGSGLFDGQSQAFFDAVVALAQAADAAIREG
ncbi:MAG: ferritin-like domain-containing protein [Vicinamibacteraceae bacterium]